MIGLLFLIEVALWLFILKWVVKAIGSQFPARPWRTVAMVGIFVVMLPLPLLDEIVGGWQFKRLCEANVVHVDKDTARGTTVYEERVSSPLPVSGTWVNVRKWPFHFLDTETGKVVVSFDQFYADGGRLFPGFDSGHDPLTFEGECHPPGTFDKGFIASLGFIELKLQQSK